MNLRTSSSFGSARIVAAVLAVSVLVGCSPAPNTSQPASAGDTATTAPTVDPAVGAARESVSLFYTAVAKLRPSGAPTAEQRTELAPLLSAELIGLLERADAARTAARAAAPMEKPPFTDGDLFSSLFEGPTAFTVGEPQTGAAGEWRVPVTLTYSTGAKDERKAAASSLRILPLAVSGTSPTRARCSRPCARVSKDNKKNPAFAGFFRARLSLVHRSTAGA
jgi:hypothetical protein